MLKSVSSYSIAADGVLFLMTCLSSILFLNLAHVQTYIGFSLLVKQTYDYLC